MTFALTEKKTLGATERKEAARTVWREQMSGVDAKQLVIVDETGSNIGPTPLYAWTPKGERADGRVPRNYGKNTTRLSSLSLQGMGAAMILEGATDSIAFELYIEQVLAPSLQPGQIVVMDNLSSHTSSKVPRFGRPSKPGDASYCFCLPILPTCLPLKRLSPSSKLFCVGSELAHAKTYSKPFLKP